MKILHVAGAARPHAHGFDLPLTGGFTLSIRAMGEHLLRAAVAPEGGLPVDRSWMVAPDGDVPWEGRPRDDMTGFDPPETAFEAIEGGARLTAGAFRVTASGGPVRLAVEQMTAQGWRPWTEDRATGGFVLEHGGRTLRHYQQRPLDDAHYGLGDKTGPVDRTGRRFRMLQLDALGYDAEIGDPLYKHVPFVIVRRADGETGAGVHGGLFYDTLAPMTFDLGCERSNYHGIYRYVEAEEPALDLWLIAGPDVASVVKRFTLLTGRPAPHPRWSYGFAFTTMHHADDRNAQAVMSAFLDRCREERIPLSALHFGSGYSSRGRRRYVFTWNREKYPDPGALFAKLREMGLPSVANLKPVLIDDHVNYAELKAAGGFVEAADGSPVLEQFWDGMGSFLDFTNPETVRWWQERLRAQVLDVGFTAGWNDNNEYEIGREDAAATGFGRALPATATRPLHALMMTRATWEATQARQPETRPFTITRAGPAGLQRYAETWTGDNFTSWHTLKWNLRNAQSLALSGQSKVGHDVGGFTGPRPGPELLCRMVEASTLHPRAVMNSWKPQVADDWTAATVPWLHPETTDAVRRALDLRTTFLPLMYALGHRAHRDGEPIIRPLFHDFPDDPACRLVDHDGFMLGRDVLFSPVVEEGARTKRQHLPAGPAGWIDFHDLRVHPGGEMADVEAPLGRPPIFVRSGAALVLAGETPHVRPHDAPPRLIWLGIAGARGEGEGWHWEDDGVSWGFRQGRFLEIRLRYAWDASHVTVRIERVAGDWPLPPAGDWRVAGPLGGRDVRVEC